VVRKENNKILFIKDSCILHQKLLHYKKLHVL
jgi:hypothetical protein